MKQSDVIRGENELSGKSNDESGSSSRLNINEDDQAGKFSTSLTGGGGANRGERGFGLGGRFQYSKPIGKSASIDVDVSGSMYAAKGKGYDVKGASIDGVNLTLKKSF